MMCVGDMGRATAIVAVRKWRRVTLAFLGNASTLRMSSSALVAIPCTTDFLKELALMRGSKILGLVARETECEVVVVGVTVCTR
jgi:hypothetical protein